MSRQENEEVVQGIAALYGGILQNLSTVQSADNAVESKSIGTVGAALAVMGILTQLTQAWHALTILSLILLGGSLGLGLWCLRIRNYQNATVSLSDHPEYLEKATETLIRQLISDAEAAADDGTKKLSRKADIFQWALWLFVAGTAIGILSLKLKLIII